MEFLQNLIKHRVYFFLLLLICCNDVRTMVMKNRRIISGEVSLFGRPSFVVSVVVYGTLKCGGSIVSNYFVLTAAHCCFRKQKMEDVSSMEVSVGNVYWRDGQFYDVHRMIVHEEYDRPTTRNDVALLKMANRIKFGTGVTFVKLYPGLIDDEVEMRATVFGWGYHDNKDGKLLRKVTEDLRQVDIYTVPQRICRKFYRKVTDNNICMTNSNTQGSCKGDSGGPLCMNIDHSVYQIGIVSFGGECNNTKPEVYTRISSFYKWIKQNMKNNP